jgi:hypothetical protein
LFCLAAFTKHDNSPSKIRMATSESVLNIIYFF